MEVTLLQAVVQGSEMIETLSLTHVFSLWSFLM